MARTDDGALLTVQHRQAQVQLRARALRDYMLIWPLWEGDEGTFGRLVDASITVVRAHHRISAALAGSYYQSFRGAERVAGSPTPRLADPVNPEKVAASLYVTGRVMTGKAILAGKSPQAAMQTALVRTSGAVTRHVLAGGRDTLVLSAGEDAQATGWARVTSGNPCAFCAMIAGRGPVYKGEDTAEFQAHDGCACMAEPAYAGSEWPGRAREYRDLYNRATREAREADPNADLLNAFRRAYEAA